MWVKAMKAMKVILFGTSKHLRHVYDVVCQDDDTVLSIVYPDNRKHTDKVMGLITFAQEKNIPTIVQPMKRDIGSFFKQIERLKPDIGVVWSYSQIIPLSIIHLFPKGLINFHGAYLPHYRGANVLNWVLVNGETETGVTLHYIDEGIDTGDILAQKKVSISHTDDAYTLSNKLETEAIHLFTEIWPKLKNGTIQGTPQDHSEATYYKRRTWEDGEINWCKTAIDIYNLVRALVRPFPGAFFRYRERIYQVWKASICDTISRDFPCGQIIEINDLSGHMKVQTSRGIIQLETVECEGQPISLAQHFHSGITLHFQSINQFRQ